MIDPKGQHGTKIVKFSFEAMILEENGWKPIVRFDTGEGSNLPCVHVHQFYRDGREEKRRLNWGDIKQAADKCQHEITKNLGRYLDVYRDLI